MHIDLHRLEEITNKLTNPSRIVVLEDDISYSQMFSRVFTEKGYCFTLCDNGSDATRLLRENKVDALFLDIVVPEPDGIEILNTIRKMERKPLIVLISGVHNKDFLQSLMDIYPIVCWISKPFNESAVRSVLNHIRLIPLCKNE